MPAKNQHEYSADGVAAYMRENIGTRYICAGLARVSHVDTDDMRETLIALVDQGRIEMVAQARNKLYFVRTEAEIAAIAKQSAPKLRGEYRQSGAAWSEVARRLAEFRAGPSVYAELEKAC